jgi:hypothetical protein
MKGTEGMSTQAGQFCSIGQCHPFLFLNCNDNTEKGKDYSPKWKSRQAIGNILQNGSVDKPLGIFSKMGQERLSIFWFRNILQNLSDVGSFKYLK